MVHSHDTMVHFLLVSNIVMVDQIDALNIDMNFDPTWVRYDPTFVLFVLAER